MKKWLLVLLAGAGFFIMGLGIGVFVGTRKKKAAAVTVVGSADGPTSIFLAGKLR